MKKISPLLLLLISALTISAKTHRYEIKTEPFTKLDVVNDLAVDCKFVPDSIGYVVFNYPDELADAIYIENKGKGKLKLMISPDFIDKDIELPKLTVYADMLESVQSNSEKTVRVIDLPRAPKFSVRLIDNGRIEVTGINVTQLVAQIATGNGSILLEGKAGDAVYKLTGTGSIQAQNLNASKVSTHVLGGGEIFCWPQTELVLKGLGSTRVYYRGTPGTIKKSGFGKLIPMN